MGRERQNIDPQGCRGHGERETHKCVLLKLWDVCSERGLHRGRWDTHKDKAPKSTWNSQARLPGVALELGLKGWVRTDEANGDKDGSGVATQAEETDGPMTRGGEQHWVRWRSECEVGTEESWGWRGCGQTAEGSVRIVGKPGLDLKRWEPRKIYKQGNHMGQFCCRYFSLGCQKGEWKKHKDRR